MTTTAITEINNALHTIREAAATVDSEFSDQADNAFELIATKAA